MLSVKFGIVWGLRTETEVRIYFQYQGYILLMWFTCLQGAASCSKKLLVTFTSPLAAENSVFTANTCSQGCLLFVLGGRQTTEQPMYLMNRMNLGIPPTVLNVFWLYSTGNYSVETKKLCVTRVQSCQPCEELKPA